jgi:hypothetical protein
MRRGQAIRVTVVELVAIAKLSPAMRPVLCGTQAFISARNASLNFQTLKRGGMGQVQPVVKKIMRHKCQLFQLELLII